MASRGSTDPMLKSFSSYGHVLPTFSEFSHVRGPWPGTKKDGYEFFNYLKINIYKKF